MFSNFTLPGYGLRYMDCYDCTQQLSSWCPECFQLQVLHNNRVDLSHIRHIVVSHTLMYCYCGRGVFRPLTPDILVEVAGSSIPGQPTPHNMVPGANIDPALAHGAVIGTAGVHPGANPHGMQQTSMQMWVTQSDTMQSYGVNPGGTYPAVWLVPNTNSGVFTTMWTTPFNNSIQ